MKPNHRGIESRVLLVALSPVVVTAFALTLYFIVLRYNDVELALQQRGLTMAHQLAPAAQYGLFSGNSIELKRLIQAVAKEPDVSAISVYDQHGVPLVIQGQPLASPSPDSLPNGWLEQKQTENIIAFHHKVFSTALSLDDPYVSKSASNASPLLLGSITIELSRDRLVAKKREILFVTSGAAFLILIIAALIARRLGRDISEPVLALEAAVRKVREGRLAARVGHHPAGTLRSLEEGINSMAAALERAQQLSTNTLFRTETALQRQSDLANALIEAQSNAGVCMTIVEDGKIVYANQAGLNFVGRNWAETNRMGIADLFVSPHRELFDQTYQAVLRGEKATSRIEINLTTKDGTSRWAEVAAFSISHGDKRQIAILGIDVTQRKLDAQQLMLAHLTTQKQKEEAERASAAKSRFLAAASHDLRQPLHAITLFSDQLHERVVTPELIHLSTQMSDAIKDMSELLQSLLDISRIDLSPMNPEIRPVELEPLLNDVAASYWQVAANKQVRLTVVKTSLRISTDPHHITRILCNLVANAVRYTEQGTVLIGARRVGDNVRIEVWDSGIGVEAEHLPLLFQEFYQVANPERDMNKGLGLGLAIVERLSRILGHTISVNSTPGKGSVFRLVVQRAFVPTANSSASAFAATSIMLVLHDQKLRTEISELLTGWGYDVVASDIEPAVLLPKEILADVIICDLTALDKLQKQPSPYTVRGDVRPAIIVFGEPTVATSTTDMTETLLSLPLKPAKLRALLLHLLTERTS